MTEPSTPTEPVEPTAPDVDPTEPAEPVQPTEPEAPTEPVEPTEPVAESGEGEQGTLAEGEPFDAPSEQHIARVPTIEDQKKQQDRDLAKLEKENARHDARVREILGEDSQYLVNCPLCADEPAGFLVVTEAGVIGEEKLDQLKMLLGIGQPSSLKPHPTIVTCETCGGEGYCATGSHRTGYEQTDCPVCFTKGWFDTAEPQNQKPATNGATNGAAMTGPTVYTEPPPVETFSDDPAVQSLRDRGFMVVPPMAINAG